MSNGTRRFNLYSAPREVENNSNDGSKRKIAGVEVGPENRDIKGKYSEIFFIEEVVEIDPVRISGGNFGDVYKKIYKIVENGKDVILAKKEFKGTTKPSSTEMRRLFEIQSDLKNVGIPVLDIYTDGESLYSPYLNRDGIVVVSGNNEPPSSYESEVGEIRFFDEKIKIKNLDEVLDKILDVSIKSRNAGVLLSLDCLFFCLIRIVVNWIFWLGISIFCKRIKV